MITIINDDILNAIGWAIIHSLWQVGLLSILLFIVLRIIKGYSANLKYWLSCITLFTSAFLFFRSIINNLNPPRVGIESDVQSLTVEFDRTLTNLVNSGSFNSSLESILPYIVIAYFIGLLIFTIRFTYGIFSIYKLRTSGIIILHNKWKNVLVNLLAKVGVRREVKMFESYNVNGPVVIGYLKPIILFPIGLLSSMNTQEVEAIILHELAHIKRNDFLVNMLQCAIETIMFYNPFIWWISNNIRKEREYCCDELAIEETTSLTYAKALANISHFEHNSTLITAANNNRGDLFKRIKHITTKSTLKRKTMDKFITAIILLGSTILLSWYSIDLTHKIKIEEAISTEILEIPKSESMLLTLDTIPSEDDLQKIIIEQKQEIARLKSKIDQAQKTQKPLTIELSSKYESLTDSISSLAMELSKKALENQELVSKLEIEDINLQLQNKMEQIQKMNLDVNEEVLIELKQSLQVAELQKLEALKELDHVNELVELESKKVKELKEQISNFSKEATPELIKDGYLKKSEKIESISFDNEKLLKINGTKIKSKHAEKYRKLIDKHLDKSIEFELHED